MLSRGLLLASYCTSLQRKQPVREVHTGHLRFLTVETRQTGGVDTDRRRECTHPEGELWSAEPLHLYGGGSPGTTGELSLSSSGSSSLFFLLLAALLPESFRVETVTCHTHTQVSEPLDFVCACVSVCNTAWTDLRQKTLPPSAALQREAKKKSHTAKNDFCGEAGVKTGGGASSHYAPPPLSFCLSLPLSAQPSLSPAEIFLRYLNETVTFWSKCKFGEKRRGRVLSWINMISMVSEVRLTKSRFKTEHSHTRQVSQP